MLPEFLEKHLQSYFVAQSFLTRIPVPKSPAYSDQQIGKAVLYYPAIGFVLGLIAIVMTWLFSSANPWLLAILLVTVSIVLTGALHLDGLSDTADAWLGGHGNKEKIFSIMKDPRAGTAGVTVIVLIILLKTIALMVLLEANVWFILFLAPIYARLAVAALIYFLPAAKSEGLAYQVKQNIPIDTLAFLLLITSIILFLLSPVYLIFAGITFLVIKQMTVKLLDGFTGDTLGAAIEIMETSSFVIAALLVSQ